MGEGCKDGGKDMGEGWGDGWKEGWDGGVGIGDEAWGRGSRMGGKIWGGLGRWVLRGIDTIFISDSSAEKRPGSSA